LLVGLVALGAVRKAIRRAIGLRARMLIAAGIEYLDSGVLLRGQFHHTCARRCNGVVRKEHRREKYDQVAYLSQFHFNDTSTRAGCLRNENPSLLAAIILVGTPLRPLIQINRQHLSSLPRSCCSRSRNLNADSPPAKVENNVASDSNMALMGAKYLDSLTHGSTLQRGPGKPPQWH
jgi:hypothetical protein